MSFFEFTTIVILVYPVHDTHALFGNWRWHFFQGMSSMSMIHDSFILDVLFLRWKKIVLLSEMIGKECRILVGQYYQSSTQPTQDIATCTGQRVNLRIQAW